MRDGGQDLSIEMENVNGADWRQREMITVLSNGDLLAIRRPCRPTLPLAVVKQQVQVVIPVVDLHPLLAGHETEAYPQFEDEGFHLPQDRRLQILLGVGVFQPEKIEDVGIAEDQIGCELIFLAQLLEFQRRQFFWLPRQRGALEEHGTDLLSQRALVPALDAAHLGIEVALERVVQVDNEREVGPTQLCSQWLHNSGIREDLGKAHHIEEVTPREATGRTPPPIVHSTRTRSAPHTRPASPSSCLTGCATPRANRAW